MARSAFTLRLASDERTALEDLSRIERRPMNQILNDAIKAKLHRQSDSERALADSLDKLRAYRERDPEFKEAIAAVAKAEASFEDPLEGTVFKERSKARTHAKAQPSSAPVQDRIRDLLNA